MISRLGWLALCAGAIACQRTEPPAVPRQAARDAAQASPALDAAGARVARFRARALYESGHLKAAAQAFGRLARSPVHDDWDFIGLALVRLELEQPAPALEAVRLGRAAKVSRAQLDYLEGHARRALRDAPGAVKAFAAAAKAAPDAPEAAYWLGVARQEAGDPEGALRVLSALADRGPSAGSMHDLPALYRKGRLLLLLGRKQEGAAAVAAYQARFAAAGRPALVKQVLFHGRLTALDIPPPPPATTGAAIPLAFKALRPPPSIRAAGAAPGALAVIWTEQGAMIVWGGEGGQVEAWRPGGARQTLWRGSAGPIASLTRLDLDADGDDDLYVGRRGGDWVLLQEGAGWRPVRAGGPASAAPTLAVVPVDLDHDGDLDLVRLAAQTRFLRNAGPAGPHEPAGSPPADRPPIRLDDASAERGLDRAGAREGGLQLDADGDGAVDLLLWGRDGVALLRNPWVGAFADVAAASNLGGARARAAAAIDVDGDGRPDLLLLDERLRLYHNQGRGRFATGRPIGPGGRQVAAGDLDNDGDIDLVVAGPDGVFTVAQTHPGGFGPPERIHHPGGGALVLADVDADGRLDVVVTEAAGALLLRNVSRGAGRSISIELAGQSSNKGGVGAEIELQAGPLYLRRRYLGGRLHVGLGSAQRVDTLRVRWPTGSFQGVTDLPAGQPVRVEEPAGLTGSCPFLYVWDGARYRYHGDFLGQAPVGIPIGPGFITPDFDEPLLIEGELMKPTAPGEFTLQLKEEFREITYLDAVRLFALDRPEGSYVAADGRCKAPPFPEREIYASAQVRPPRAARDQAGRDVLDRLLRRDGRPFESFRLTRHEGVVTEHALELDLGPIEPGDRPILYLEGWTYWAGSDTEAALAHEPGRSRPPRLEIPDGRGGWQIALADMGFPAGTTTRAIPIRLEGILRRDDPRVRIVTNLHIYWDRALVASDGGDLPIRRSPMLLRSADYHHRGLATLVETGARSSNQRWDYDRLVPTEALRWGQIPGPHTPYGDVLRRLRDPDDQVVTLDAGDEITAIFDGSALPELPPGDRRDYLMTSWGWDKDAHFHTAGGQVAGPLPFREMGTYPYGPDVTHPAEDAIGSRSRPARPMLPDLRLEAMARR